MKRFNPILKGVLIGFILGAIVAAIFLLTKDMQGIGNTGIMLFRVLVFILTLPLALPFFFIPVDNLNINPYIVATVLLLLNWMFMGGLIAYLKQNREKIIPVMIALSLVVVGGGFYVVIKTISVISNLNS